MNTKTKKKQNELRITQKLLKVQEETHTFRKNVTNSKNWVLYSVSSSTATAKRHLIIRSSF